MDLLTDKYEMAIRLGFFFGILVIMFLWELIAPRRPLIASKTARWSSNLGLVLIDSVFVRLAFPAGLAGVAFLAQQRGWGIFNFFELSLLFEIILGVLILDLAIYLQHAMFHSI